jgi:hypothetical protein
LALLLGAESAPTRPPAPAFDVPIQQISLGLYGQQILLVTPGRCELRAPGQAEPTLVTTRLTELRAQDLGSLLMTSLGYGLSATNWIGDAELPRRPYVDVTVTSEAEPGGPVFGWSIALPLMPNNRLQGAWRLHSLFSLCNLGEATAVWVALAEHSPPRQKSLALALLTEWINWVDRDPNYDWGPHNLFDDCRAGNCQGLPTTLHYRSLMWADSPSPRSFAPLERSPPVEAPTPTP